MVLLRSGAWSLEVFARVWAGLAFRGRKHRDTQRTRPGGSRHHATLVWRASVQVTQVLVLALLLAAALLFLLEGLLLLLELLGLEHVFP